jgi:hypothetical protein
VILLGTMLGGAPLWSLYRECSPGYVGMTSLVIALLPPGVAQYSGLASVFCA